MIHLRDVCDDPDADGACDDVDNCPELANADQLDSDEDNMGDACDEGPNDADGDGACDSDDNCPNTPNTDQADSNGDGEGDACTVPPALGTSWVYNVSYSDDPKVADNTTIWTYNVSSADGDTFIANATIEGTPQAGFYFADMGTSFRGQKDAYGVTRDMSNFSSLSSSSIHS